MTRFELFDWVRYKNGDRIGMVMEVYGYSRKGSYLVWFPGLAAGHAGRDDGDELWDGSRRDMWYCKSSELSPVPAPGLDGHGLAGAGLVD